MIAERILGLEDNYLTVPSEPPRRRKAGNAAADYEEICAFHRLKVSLLFVRKIQPTPPLLPPFTATLGANRICC
jgi:hypothetical protein